MIDFYRNAKNGPYRVKTLGINNGVTDVYCQMTSLQGCSGGGWTMALKIDGKKVLKSVTNTMIKLVIMVIMSNFGCSYSYSITFVMKKL